MRYPRSLQARLALAIGLPVTILWLAAASLTAQRINHEMDEVFDKFLEATAQRILPIALHDLRRKRQYEHDDDDDDGEEQIRRLGPQDEEVKYIVRNDEGRVLMRSDGAVDSIFPPFEGRGFRQSATHRLYYDAAREGDLTIAVAEPLDHRAEMARAMLVAMVLPLLVVIPLSLTIIVLAVRGGFRPVRVLQQALANRGAHDLSPLPETDLPTELAPITGGVNQLFDRLRAAFEAERAFAANAAHELRTPVAGAIAQAQRLQTETHDEKASMRGKEIESALKRLMRMSEKLMQLARAEGSQLRLEMPSDLRPILQLIVGDFIRAAEGRISLSIPLEPVLSNLDPDAFGILCRNLVENALRHGTPDRPVSVTLTASGEFVVENEGPVMTPDAIDRLMQRFERGSAAAGGSGLGLAIVKAIADRAGARIAITSPLRDKENGVSISVSLPTSTSV